MGASETGKRRYWLAGKREESQDRFFVEALDPALWEAGDAQAWDACWYTGMPAPEVFEQLAPGKTVNHIPGNNALTVKSLLYRTLREARERWEGQGGIAGERAGRLAFFPRTFAMPGDYHALQHEAARRPDQRWILKPKNAARGRDIRVLDDVARVPTGERWMVQEYVGNPHTLEGCKYALRLYALITSVEPLRLYLYREGSAKLASEPYEPENIGNVFAHLTNPDVNARNVASPSPVRFLPLADYRARLRAEGHDDAALFERLHDLVTLTAIAAREAMRRRCRRVRADTRGCYELLGLDCLIDQDLNPWLMECNLSPSLDICAAPEDGGIYETRTKRQMVADLVAMLGLNDPGPPLPPLAEATDPEAELRRRDETELARAGDFQRLYPAGNAARYLPCFPLPRLADVALADARAGGPVARPQVTPRGVAEVVTERSLSLYGEGTGTLYRPNATAAWIWLQATAGKDPDTVARELAQATGTHAGERAPWAAREQVWTALADWAASGLLWQRTGDTAPVETAPDTAYPAAPPADAGVQVGERRILLQEVPAPVLPRLRQALGGRIVGAAPGADVHLRLAETRTGYTVSENGAAVAEGLTLATVVPQLCRLLLARAAAAPDELLLDAVLMALPMRRDDDPAAVMVLGARHGLADGLASVRSAPAGRGVRWAPEQGIVSGLGLPLRRPLDDGGVLPAGAYWHEWGRAEGGQLLAADAGALVTGSVRELMLVDEAAAEATAADPGAVLAALLPGCVTAAGDRPTAAAVERLADWVMSRSLRVAAPAAADEALARLLRAPAAASVDA
ncbi:amylase [Sediminicurvatus halobius]|uniref:Amylase n=1 Tax=Sediminicurvatus halobius TaxID=2182432 RepID=A0A2U2N1Y5_9GAMM|nr:amylase [Spiribacter halobius]PWG63082.1 amylase [Spiribacter halobius]UEX77530.1 hypothetical protein LMH63_16575 [Spiribacter halobius]